MKNPPVFIDLFAGCGGLSLGLLNAGWKGCFAIERTPDAYLTYKHNLIDGERFQYDWPHWLPKEAHDIENFLSGYKEKLAQLSGEIDLIAGAPPCQGFSPAGKRDPKDPRNRLAERYIEAVRILKPKFLLMENVRGFNARFTASARKHESIPYSQVVKRRLEKEGYDVQFRVLTSADWGVPQTRPRFILIATRKDINLKWSPIEELINRRSSFLKARSLDPIQYQTTSAAISDLCVEGKEKTESLDGEVTGFMQIIYREPDKLTNFQSLMRKGMLPCDAPNSLRLTKHKPHIIERNKKILKECPKGRSLSKEERERYGLKKHSITPLCPDSPSATMTTLPDDHLHYSEPRILTVREIARIQSFPDWFSFLGQYTTGGAMRKESCPRYTQVGNAVPPLLAEGLGELLIEAVKKADGSQIEAA